ncbi:MAG: hypothetical protein IPL71_06740 [Anaerolineales bacterium]|uniref:hypothetical protein n=1 Tax=Candidatus Villigracilis proximus TaxID=3140683 RepID=UPI0031370CEC|nr:hypothetical protein [Anaerolineales bacterium]
MSKKEEWRKLLENKIKKRKEYIKNVKELVEVASEAEEQNKEDEAKLFFVENMPESILAERGQPLFLFEQYDEEQLNTYLPGLSKINADARKYILTSGTTDSSAYAEIVETYRVSKEVLAPYTTTFTTLESKSIEEVSIVFSDLAKEKAKKENLPPRLNKINENLGDMFTIALQNYNKTKIGLGMVHQSAMDLRVVLQQLWGGLVALARKKDSAQTKRHRFEMAKQGDRIFIVECLIVEDVEKKKLISSLDILAKALLQFSDGDFGKNLLGDDKEKLNNLYNLWVLSINIANSIVPSIELQE